MRATHTVLLAGSVAAAFVCLSGCALDHSVYLQGTLNETALASIQPNEHLQPHLLFTSSLPNPVVWTTSEDPLGVPHNFSMDISAAFSQDLHDYMKMRFPLGTSAGDLKTSAASFEVHLSTFSLAKHLDGSGRMVADTNLAMDVVVWRAGARVGQKTIEVGNESSAYANMIPAYGEIFSHCIDGNLNKAIILLDKYLSTSGL
jgi:hypothetical protein